MKKLLLIALMGVIMLVGCDTLFMKGTGTIVFRSEPKGAFILLDGEHTCLLTNNTLENVEVGAHEVSFWLEGYENYNTTVSVRKDQTTFVEVKLVSKIPKAN